MNIGKLKDKVSIQELSQTTDSEGTVVNAYTEVFKRFADVRPARGREAYINDQFLSEIDYVVVMRYDGQTRNITGKHEIIYKGQRLRQVAVPINVENQDKELRFFCRVVADGR